jgi:hypothetical protein
MRLLLTSPPGKRADLGLTEVLAARRLALGGPRSIFADMRLLLTSPPESAPISD